MYIYIYTCISIWIFHIHMICTQMITDVYINILAYIDLIRCFLFMSSLDTIENWYNWNAVCKWAQFNTVRGKIGESVVCVPMRVLIHSQEDCPWVAIGNGLVSSSICKIKITSPSTSFTSIYSIHFHVRRKQYLFKQYHTIYRGR